MSRFSGKQYPGAMKAHRDKKKAEAAERQRLFDIEYNESGETDRKVFAQIRRVGRISRADH